MKNVFGYFAAIMVLFLTVATLLVAGKPAEETTERVSINEDYAVSIEVKTEEDGTLTANVIDGSSENQLLTSVTSIRQEADGVEIVAVEEDTSPTTMHIKGAHIVEVCPN